MYKCHDCDKKIKTNGKLLLNGLELVYDNGGKKITILKCQECFDKDKSLKNFQKCEVYSRVVGYLRPVQEWNVGKRAEYQNKKIYKLHKSRKPQV